MNDQETTKRAQRPSLKTRLDCRVVGGFRWICTSKTTAWLMTIAFLIEMIGAFFVHGNYAAAWFAFTAAWLAWRVAYIEPPNTTLTGDGPQTSSPR